MKSKIVFSILLGLALLLTACGPQSTPAPAATQPPAQSMPTEAPSATTSSGSATAMPADTMSAGGAASVMVSKNDTLGSFLVDSKGMTLYIFLKDSPNTSTCSGSCLQIWPALTTDGAPVAGEGVDASLLGTIQRDDGSTQVTYNGWPLYYYAQDMQPGDVNGQGVGQVWYVISPTGDTVYK
jgi:predicted lipoprotein with Yx(FWY)xxD motif